MWFQTSKFRVTLGIIAFLGALFAPWWVPLIFGTLLCLRYAAWEVLLLGLFVDMLWLPQTLFTTIPLATIVAFFLVFGLAPLRKELLIHVD